MKTTNSLMFVPEKSLNVKKQMMMGNSTSFNPLLRNINVKNNGNSNFTQNKVRMPLSVSPPQTQKPTRLNSGRTFIKNNTGGPILINILNGHNEQGYPNYKEIKILDYIRKDKLTKEDLESPEVMNLYDANKIIDILEDQHHEEIENKKNKQTKKQSKMRQDFHDLDTVRNESKYIEAGGKQIQITEDLYSDSGRTTEDFEVRENTRLTKETEVLMGGGMSLDDGIDDLIPGGQSYSSRRSSQPQRERRDNPMANSRPVAMSDPERAIKRA